MCILRFVNNTVYKAAVTTASGDTELYIGMMERSFKARYSNHKHSIEHRKHWQLTILSKYIEELTKTSTDCTI
jgi:hypothetical protein